MTPELIDAIVAGVLKLGTGLVSLVGGIWLAGKFLDALKAKWGKK